MKRFKLLPRLGRIILLLSLVVPSPFVLASGGRPTPPSGIYALVPIPDDPAPAPKGDFLPDTRVYNQLNMAPPPVQPGEAKGSNGPGVSDKYTGISDGLTLFSTPTACLDFNNIDNWHGRLWYASYGGWGTFAVDDGGLYEAKNVRFEMERVVGPGDRTGSEYSFKISSGQPYAAGLISPVFQVPAGAKVTVRAKYLIFDHEGVNVGGQWINDWVSLGVKPNAYEQDAQYVNGYNRGVWSQIDNEVVAGKSGQILIMLQAESPAPFNSNVYFDDIEIYVNGAVVSDCE